MSGYLEDRLNETGVGTIYETCKALAVPLAANIVRELEAEGRFVGHWHVLGGGGLP